MSKIFLFIALTLPQLALAGQEQKTELVVKAYYDVFSGEYSQDLVVSVVTEDTLQEAYLDHYAFSNEDDFDSFCYVGSAEDALNMVEQILNKTTGDSWQTLGEATITEGVVRYPFSYVGEGGEVDGLEAVVAPCE